MLLQSSNALNPIEYSPAGFDLIEENENGEFDDNCYEDVPDFLKPIDSPAIQGTQSITSTLP